GDGFFPARGASAELIRLARETAAQHGRDPQSIEITTSLPPSLDDIGALEARGVDRVLVPVTAVVGLPTAISNPDDVRKWRPTIERYAGVDAQRRTEGAH